MKKIVVFAVVSTKRDIRKFHVMCRATTAKKCTKKRDARAKLLLLLLPSWLFKFPMVMRSLD